MASSPGWWRAASVSSFWESMLCGSRGRTRLGRQTRLGSRLLVPSLCLPALVPPRRGLGTAPPGQSPGELLQALGGEEAANRAGFPDGAEGQGLWSPDAGQEGPRSVLGAARARGTGDSGLERKVQTASAHTPATGRHPPSCPRATDVPPRGCRVKANLIHYKK